MLHLGVAAHGAALSVLQQFLTRREAICRFAETATRFAPVLCVIRDGIRETVRRMLPIVLHSRDSVEQESLGLPRRRPGPSRRLALTLWHPVCGCHSDGLERRSRAQRRTLSSRRRVERRTRFSSSFAFANHKTGVSDPRRVVQRRWVL